jgi:hypothetical protein
MRLCVWVGHGFLGVWGRGREGKSCTYTPACASVLNDLAYNQGHGEGVDQL